MQPVLDLLHHTVASPWVYLVIFLACAIDGFLPVVPSESVVIVAAVFAAGGHPDIVAVAIVTAIGALVGDHVSYLLGRASGARRLARLPANSRRRAYSDRAGRALGRHGGLILLSARYVPGGRTAVTLTMGAVRYPRRSFLLFDTVAVVCWALYCTLLGVFGGLAFERDPVKGLLLGLGLSLAVTATLEALRRARR